MTWHSFGLICVLALGVLPMTGCSDAGAPGREFPCTEQGIRGAIAEGGGPYTFDCDGPTTVAVEGAFEVENDVILDGESGLTLDGATFIVRDEKVKLDLLGFTIINGEVISYGRLFMRDCTVSDGGSGTGAGIVNVAGTTTLTDCTVARNLGGIWNSGTLTATNCTVSQNVGVFDQSYGGIFNNATLTLTNSTVSGNFGFGGLPNDIVNIGTLAIANTLVDGECFADRETVTSNGHNIESPGNTCGFDQTGDQSGVSADDLKLGLLADNGGQTMTHAPGLLPTPSVAIDVIPEAACLDADGAALTTDQRGEPRPVAIWDRSPSATSRVRAANRRSLALERDWRATRAPCPGCRPTLTQTDAQMLRHSGPTGEEGNRSQAPSGRSWRDLCENDESEELRIARHSPATPRYS